MVPYNSFYRMRKLVSARPKITEIVNEKNKKNPVKKSKNVYA